MIQVLDRPSIEGLVLDLSSLERRVLGKHAAIGAGYAGWPIKRPARAQRSARSEVFRRGAKGRLIPANLLATANLSAEGYDEVRPGFYKLKKCPLGRFFQTFLAQTQVEFTAWLTGGPHHTATVSLGADS